GRFATGHNPCSFTEPRRNVSRDALELFVRDERTHLRFGIEAVAYFDLLRGRGHAVQHLVKDMLVHVEPRSCTTTLPVVEEDGVGGAGNGRLYVGIAEHDGRRLAAKFERHAFEIAGSRVDNQLANFSRTGKRDLVDVGMRSQGGAGGFAVASENIYDALRETRLFNEPAQTKRRERRFLRHPPGDPAPGPPAPGRLPRGPSTHGG